MGDLLRAAVSGWEVLLSLTTALLMPIAPQAITEVYLWVLPSGGAAAVSGDTRLAIVPDRDFRAVVQARCTDIDAEH